VTLAEDTAVFAAGSTCTWWSILEFGPRFAVFDTRDSSWDNVGATSPCNLALPYTKFAQSVGLAAAGHWDTWVGWHPEGEYFDMAVSILSSEHDNYTTGVDVTSASEAASHNNFGLDFDWTHYDCPLWDGANTLISAGERTAVIIHEGWHHHEYRIGYGGHFTGPIDRCTVSGAACDYNFPHTVLDFLPGGPTGGDLGFFELSADGKTAIFDHSAYQVAIESQCDMVTQPEPWVPVSVTLSDSAIIGIRSTSNFRNVVPWVCGSPLPFD
jgi:hypothetical protein